jgi:nitroimidazol reductase NimA-like FMN-containing flavoprotein (pyridoxamine 5'-phosphate oxidase superfamily)
MAEFQKTDKTTITRLPKRGVYDKDTVHSILDEGLFCTLAYVRDGVPFQIPTNFCRMGDKVYVHGSVGSFYMRELAEKKLQTCISVTILDGLVLARSAFHHSVNYRSVVLFSQAEKVSDESEVYRSLEVLTNKMQPGRWNDIRLPDAGEMKATMVLSFAIEEVSAKVRAGGPVDDEQDYDLDYWAGVVPIKMQRGQPIADARLKSGVVAPSYLG